MLQEVEIPEHLHYFHPRHGDVVMNRSNIYQIFCKSHEIINDREMSSMKNTDMFARELVNDYATFDGSGISIKSSQLPFSVRKIFLSLIVPHDDYVFYCEDNVRLSCAIDNHEQVMQRHLDQHVESIYHHIMQESSDYWALLPDGNIENQMFHACHTYHY